MHTLQNIHDRINAGSIRTGVHVGKVLARAYNTKFTTLLPLANVLDGPSSQPGSIPCDDVFVKLIGGGLGAFLITMLEIASGIGLICIILGGLLRISALTTQKKEDKDERMFLSKFAFLCAGIVLTPALIFLILVLWAPSWFGLGDKTCP